MIKYTPYIIQYDNVVDDEKLDYYTQFLSESFKGKKSDVSRQEGRKNDAYTLNYYCKNNPELASINKELDQISFKSLLQYYKDCPLAKAYFGPREGLYGLNLFRTYDEQDSYEWHCDEGPHMRFIASFLLYLNDDFEGGETMFLNDRLKIKPKKGSVLMFPCGPYFIHKSSRIRSGNKHVIWNCFRDYFRHPNLQNK
jgi:hypothetical protein